VQFYEEVGVFVKNEERTEVEEKNSDSWEDPKSQNAPKHERILRNGTKKRGRDELSSGGPPSFEENAIEMKLNVTLFISVHYFMCLNKVWAEAP
jgi:hypothetical protein